MPRIASWIEPSGHSQPQKNPRPISARATTMPASTRFAVWTCATVAPVVIHVKAVSNPPNGQNASALAEPGPATALDHTIQAIQATTIDCTA